MFRSLAIILALAVPTLASAQSLVAPTLPKECDASSLECETNGEDFTLPEGVTVKSIVTAGGNATVNGNVSGDVVTMGGDVTVHQSGVIAGSLVTMGGNANIEGTVQKDLVTMGGDARLQNGAKISGDVVTMGGNVARDAGADVLGKQVDLFAKGVNLHFDDHTPKAFNWKMPRWVAPAVQATSLLIFSMFALLFMLAMPERMQYAERKMLENPPRVFAVGVLGSLLFLGTFVTLCVTLVGIPLALMLGVAYWIACALGVTVSALALGTLIPWDKAKQHALLATSLGLLMIIAMSLVPFVGSFVLVLATFFGLGAMFSTRFRNPSHAAPLTPSTDLIADAATI